jgi:hypothetical protein
LTRQYACRQCGVPYDALPPDDIYTVARSGLCRYCVFGHNISRRLVYECQNCNHRNVLFWHFSGGHDQDEVYEIDNLEDHERERITEAKKDWIEKMLEETEQS